MPEFKGKTALVTGASSGIGEVFARKLAEDGCNLIVTARRKELLERLACELSGKHGIDVEVIVADLERDEDVARLEERLAGSNAPDILVNNAGTGLNGVFVEIDIDSQLRLLKLHDVAILRLTHAALPGMTARGNGVVINVASVGGIIPVPYNVTYSATKAFLIMFTETLHEELKGTGVRVQALCPGFTHTGIFEAIGLERSIPWILWTNTDTVVNASLKGLRRGKVVVVPGFVNRFNVMVMGITPRPLKYFILRMIERYTR
jgi:hypothetical protein